jgi:cytochrome c peroxidase
MIDQDALSQEPRRIACRWAVLLAATSVAACAGGGSAGTASVVNATGTAVTGGSSDAPGLSAPAQLGAKIFADSALSASGRQSCATCHVAQYAFGADPTAIGPDHGLPVALGGPGMSLPGFRNTPSLMYLSFSPNFYFDAAGNPYGGFFRDGRAATLATQAAAPFVSSFEMANADAAAVVATLQTRPYLADFVSLYGATVLSDPATALQHMAEAIAAFETEDGALHPFRSKYDYWQKGQAQLTAQELRGLSLFNDPSKGNCAACHPSSSADGVTPALFTDFSYDNLGVPRNQTIPANTAATAPDYTPFDSTDGIQSYYDLGICGPFRDNNGKDLFGLCGQFKVPTLRNVALSAPYFHNGRFATLKDAIGFYVRRDTNPEEWYPVTADGTVTKFDDLPALYGGQFTVQKGVPGSDAGYAGNVNTLEVPYNRHIGDTPTLDADEINAVIAFLCALTDGYDPTNPTALVLPAQCQAAASAQS